MPGDPIAKRLDAIDRDLKDSGTRIDALLHGFKYRELTHKEERKLFWKHWEFIKAQSARLDTLEAEGPTAKDFAAALHRIEKLEREFVRLSGTVSKYMSRREAADNALIAQIKSVAYDMRELQERLATVELGAFPEVSGSIAKVIGKPKGGRDNPLDRKPRSRR